MKRWFGAAVLIGVIAIAGNSTQLWTTGKPKLQVEAKAAVLMNADNGQISYAIGADKALPPASMSKMMTELLVLDDIKAGRLKWENKVTFSRYAEGVGGAQTGLKGGDTITLRDLFRAMAVYSANDAAVAAAEHAAGTEAKFVDRMNRKAKQLGLSAKTHFANATGLNPEDLGPWAPDDIHGESRMTARDTALLARHLIISYPELLSITKLTEVRLPGQSTTLRTTNWTLPGEKYEYPGSDGLKTGFTDQAGYCFTGTVSRGGTRWIAVVMGASTIDSRFTEAEKLFRFGFERGRSD